MIELRDKVAGIHGIGQKICPVCFGIGLKTNHDAKLLCDVSKRVKKSRAMSMVCSSVRPVRSRFLGLPNTSLFAPSPAAMWQIWARRASMRSLTSSEPNTLSPWSPKSRDWKPARQSPALPMSCELQRYPHQTPLPDLGSICLALYRCDGHQGKPVFWQPGHSSVVSPGDIGDGDLCHGAPYACFMRFGSVRAYSLIAARDDSAEYW